MLGHLLGKIKILFDKYNGHIPTLSQDRNNISNLSDNIWLYAFGGFIQQQEFWPCDQGMEISALWIKFRWVIKILASY